VGDRSLSHLRGRRGTPGRWVFLYYGPGEEGFSEAPVSKGIVQGWREMLPGGGSSKTTCQSNPWSCTLSMETGKRLKRNVTSNEVGWSRERHLVRGKRAVARRSTRSVSGHGRASGASKKRSQKRTSLAKKLPSDP